MSVHQCDHVPHVHFQYMNSCDMSLLTVTVNVCIQYMYITHTCTHTPACEGSLCTPPSLMSRALQHVVENCGTAFEPHLTPDLIHLVFTSLSHTNRFVRETGYKVLAAIVMIPGQSLIDVCTCVAVTLLSRLGQFCYNDTCTCTELKFSDIVECCEHDWMFTHAASVKLVMNVPRALCFTHSDLIPKHFPSAAQFCCFAM